MMISLYEMMELIMWMIDRLSCEPIRSEFKRSRSQEYQYPWRWWPHMTSFRDKRLKTETFTVSLGLCGVVGPKKFPTEAVKDPRYSLHRQDIRSYCVWISAMRSIKSMIVSFNVMVCWMLVSWLFCRFEMLSLSSWVSERLNWLLRTTCNSFSFSHFVFFSFYSSNHLSLYSHLFRWLSLDVICLCADYWPHLTFALEVRFFVCELSLGSSLIALDLCFEEADLKRIFLGWDLRYFLYCWHRFCST